MPRPPFSPTEEQRRVVRSMAAYGMKQEEIAKVMGVCSPKTLRKHFREELDLAAIEANSQVAQTMYKLAISGRNPTSTMFWLKCRSGWRESSGLPQATTSSEPFVVETSAP